MTAATSPIAAAIAVASFCLLLPVAVPAFHPACHPPRLPAAVEAALLKVPGVQSASVSLTVQQAEVLYSAAAAGGKGGGMEEQLVAAVEGCGFEAAGNPR